MSEVFELTIVHRPEKGGELRHTVTCDREMAIAWLRAEADQLSGEPEGKPEVKVMRYWQPPRSTQDDPIVIDEAHVMRDRDLETYVNQLRIGGHPMALYDSTKE